MNDIFPNPFDIQNAEGAFPAVLLVEHARNAIPSVLNGLGVSADALNTHIAWDIGIEGVSRQVSNILDIPSVYCLYSRLIVDVNRSDGDPEMFWGESDGIIISGNANLDENERRERLSNIYSPYHKAAERIVSETSRRHNGSLSVIGMHSCTKQLRNADMRPWEIGLSTYNSDDLMEKCKVALEKKGLNVGVHQPYDIRKYAGTSLDRHGCKRNIPHLLIEIRQDLIAHSQGQREWAEILSSVFQNCICR